MTEQEARLWKGVGRRLRAARERRNLTLEGTVDLLGNALTFGALGHYERGIRPLSLPEALMLAKVLHTSVGHIYGLDAMTLHDDEIRLLESFRRLPLEDRQRYLERIVGLAKLYGEPVPDERLPAVWREGSPDRRKKAKKRPKVKAR